VPVSRLIVQITIKILSNKIVQTQVSKFAMFAGTKSYWLYLSRVKVDLPICKIFHTKKTALFIYYSKTKGFHSRIIINK